MPGIIRERGSTPEAVRFCYTLADASSVMGGAVATAVQARRLFRPYGRGKGGR